MGTANESKQRERRINAGKVLLICSVLFAALWWVGTWYRAVIHDWDDCVRNNECFVCHAHAVAPEGTYEDLGENIRLCPKHSTGLQAWRWVAYGVPAILLIYEDAPMGTGRVFTPLIRWVLIAGWGATLAACAVLILLSLVQLAVPQRGLFDRYLCKTPNTCDCGKPMASWERRCPECTVSSAIRPDSSILIFAPCLRFRIANLITTVMGCVIVFILIMAVSGASRFFFPGIVATIIAVLALVAAVMTVCFLLGTVKGLWDDIIHSPIFEVTATHVKRSFVSAQESEVPEIVSGGIPLKDITAIRVSVSRLARLLKYGDVIFCTSAKPDVAVMFEGVDKPYAIKARVEMLVKQ